jgi:hypothetical protein
MPAIDSFPYQELNVNDDVIRTYRMAIDPFTRLLCFSQGCPRERCNLLHLPQINRITPTPLLNLHLRHSTPITEQTTLPPVDVLLTNRRSTPVL